MTVGSTLAARLLREWLGDAAQERITELLAIAGVGVSPQMYAGFQVGPLSLVLLPGEAEDPTADHARLMWATGPRMASTPHRNDVPLLAGCPFWIGSQAAPTAAAYAALRASGLAPQPSAIALTAALGS
jgi:hypothetical protein